MEMTENDRNMSLFEMLLEHVCFSGYRKFPMLTASEGKGSPLFLSCCSPDSLEVSWKAGVHFQLCLFIPAFVMQLLAMQFIIHSFTIFLFVLYFVLSSAVLLFPHPSKSGHAVLSFPFRREN